MASTIGDTNLLKEPSDFHIIADRDRSVVDDQLSGEEQLTVFDLVGGRVGPERGLEFYGVGHLIHVKTLGQLDPDSFGERARP